MWKRMGSILEILDSHGAYQEIAIYGCDTETYAENGEYGLKSIQLWGPSEEQYIIADDYTRPSVEVLFFYT